MPGFPRRPHGLPPAGRLRPPAPQLGRLLAQHQALGEDRHGHAARGVPGAGGDKVRNSSLLLLLFCFHFKSEQIFGAKFLLVEIANGERFFEHRCEEELSVLGKSTI